MKEVMYQMTRKATMEISLKVINWMFHVSFYILTFNALFSFIALSRWFAWIYERMYFLSQLVKDNDLLKCLFAIV